MHLSQSSGGGAYPGRRVPGPVGLTRFGSAPSSLLATLVDSAAAGRETGGAAIGHEFSPAPTENIVGRFLSDESPCLTSESSCKANATAAAAVCNKRKAPGLGPDLIRHRSSPAGFLSNLMVDIGLSGGSYSQLKPQLSFSSRQDSFSQISDLGMPEMGETNSSDEAAGQSFISSGGLAVGSWDESSSIVFSGKGAGDANGDMIVGLGSMDPNQFGLGKTSSFEMEKLFRMQPDAIPCKIRAKRGCATHPRSIAERERRTRISEKLKKLEDLVPNVDKQTSTADMLDLAVQHIKTLQGQLEKLKKDNHFCTCNAKNGRS